MDAIIESLCKNFSRERELEKLKEDELFECFAGYCFIKNLHEIEFDPQEFRLGGGGDLGIDLAGIVVNGDLLIDASDIEAVVNQSHSLDVHFIFTQAKRTEGFTAAVFTEIADNLKSIFPGPGRLYASSPDIENLSRCIEIIYSDAGRFKNDLPSISVAYCSTGRTGDELLEQKRENAESKIIETNLFDRVKFVALGARELRSYYQRATEAARVNFTMPKKVPMPKIPNVEQAYLGILPAQTLVEIITDPGGAIRKNLFYENVRDFQDYNAVNKEISKTIQDQEKSKQFSVLNNGVTIVARELRAPGEDIFMRDFQIVNGCQTCHVLFDAKDILTDDVWVNVKIIQSKDEDVISGITAATNRQTAVTDEDLEARENFHKELEQLFATYSGDQKLYYERRSGQYSSTDGIERTRIISRSVMTRAFASMFLEEPSRAGRYYKELRDARKSDLFQEKQAVKAYYASAFSIYRIEWLFRNKRVDRKYAVAKYQILMGMKLLLKGNSELPQGKRLGDRFCEAILQAAWNPNSAETIVNRLIPALNKVAKDEVKNGTLSRDMVRTQRFTEKFKKEVLELRKQNPE